MTSGDYINPLPDGYEIGIAWSDKETIKFKMKHIKQARFVLEQANNQSSQMLSLMEWFDSASLEDITECDIPLRAVIAAHDLEQDPNAEIPSPIPDILCQIRDHFKERAINREIAQWERRLEG
jgi:hypothetical protein